MLNTFHRCIRGRVQQSLRVGTFQYAMQTNGRVAAKRAVNQYLQ